VGDSMLSQKGPFGTGNFVRVSRPTGRTGPAGRATCCEQEATRRSARALSRKINTFEHENGDVPKVANTVLLEHSAPRGAMSVDELSLACGLG
jgi:hypothetical protein